jgi:hypothetical protein
MKLLMTATQGWFPTKAAIAAAVLKENNYSPYKDLSENSALPPTPNPPKMMLFPLLQYLSMWTIISNAHFVSLFSPILHFV